MIKRCTTITLAIAILGGCGDDTGSGGTTGSSGSGDGGPATAGPTADDGGSSSSASPTTATSTGDTTGDTTAEGPADSTGSSSGEPPGTSSGLASTGTDSSTGAGACGVILVEAMVDAVGNDDMLQWVQLHNTCDVDVDLSSYSIGYGGPDYGPPRVKGLQGSIAAGQCYTVGGPTTSAANGDPEFEYADDFAPGLVLAGLVGAGIALFDVPAAMVDATTVPIDAVVYGPNNDDGLIDASGLPVAVPHTAAPSEGGSIQRTSLDPTWEVAIAPSPGDCPGF